MSLAPYLRLIAVGPGRARSLSQPEARAAMELILAGQASAEAIGGFLMVLRHRGETAAEVAGFAQALQSLAGEWASLRPALDWPCYAAGRTRGLPWFVLSARLVAQAGLPVLLHGWNSFHTEHSDIRAALAETGITQARTPDEARKHLAGSGICYAPLEAFAPKALDLLNLREGLGLRSIVNTVVRMANPSGAGAVVQGVFHPSYRDLQQEAAGLMGLRDLSIIKGGGGEFERHPDKEILVYGLREAVPFVARHAALQAGHRRLGDRCHAPGDLARLWSGALHDPFAEAIVLGTAALALEACGAAAPGMGQDRAAGLWAQRTGLLVA